MPIDTETDYEPRLQHPLYTKIIPPEHNTYTIGDEYEIRIPNDEKGDDGPYWYAFEAVLVGKERLMWSEIPPLLKAYTAKTRDGIEAKNKIHPSGADGDFDADDELLVLFFLRKDETKEFIKADNERLLAQDGEVST